MCTKATPRRRATASGASGGTRAHGVGCSLADAPHRLPFGAPRHAHNYCRLYASAAERAGVLHRRSRRRVAALHPDPKLHQRHPDGRSPPCCREAPGVFAEGSRDSRSLCGARGRCRIVRAAASVALLGKHARVPPRRHAGGDKRRPAPRLHAGGTVLTLVVEGLPGERPASVGASASCRAPCSPSAAARLSATASHGRTSAERPGTGEVALVLAGVGAAATGTRVRVH